MRYASIRSMDISNGDGIGVALFTQGCDRHCRNCFNSETWDFNGGYQWTNKSLDTLIDLISKPYIKRFSLLGGEPLDQRNLYDYLNIFPTIKHYRPDLKIWVYTGYKWEELIYNLKGTEYECLISYIDVLVDGEYIDEQRDLTLKYRGSANQRVIDVQKSLLLTNGVTNPSLY